MSCFVQKNLKVKKSTLERFLEECDTIAPWFTISGNLTMPSWEKLGRDLEERGSYATPLESVRKAVKDLKIKKRAGEKEKPCWAKDAETCKHSPIPSAPPPYLEAMGTGGELARSPYLNSEVWREVGMTMTTAFPVFQNA